MPRANRYWVEGAAYHLTHRCHNREFLLKFSRDRNDYRNRLRLELAESEVSLLSYTITSNHVHLLVTAAQPDQIAELMRRVQGKFAEDYNRRKKRQGAYWSDRYHATLIDNGEHLLRCLRYIDLNMVRAGVAKHPRDWAWMGWHELCGEHKRYRLLDQNRLLARLPGHTISSFRAYYGLAIEEALAQEEDKQRNPQWTESVGVGSLPFMQRVEAALDLAESRHRLQRSQNADTSWTLREPKGMGYGSLQVESEAEISV